MTAMKAWLTTEINFGLVNVPVKMYAAIADHDLKGHLYKADTLEPVGQQWIVKDSEPTQVVAYADTVRGFETEDGTVVSVTKDELASVEEDAGKTIEVLKFSPPDQINPLALENAYYLAPADPKKTKGYVLLRETLKSQDRVAVTRYTARGKTHMAVLRAAGNKLTLQNLAWADEVRQADFPALDKPVELDPKELELAALLVQSMHGDFDPAAYTDTYTERLGELVEAKAAGGELAPVQKVEATEDVSDLLAMLQASIAKKKEAA
jgi:DNA end-binding protein Ku